MTQHAHGALPSGPAVGASERGRVAGESLEFDVVVVDSANVDHLIRVREFPLPGETVTADDHVTALGGKGANQALAAARCGARVAFVGAVGDDDAGSQVMSLLKDDGVDTTPCRDRQRAHRARLRERGPGWHEPDRRGPGCERLPAAA